MGDICYNLKKMYIGVGFAGEKGGKTCNAEGKGPGYGQD